MTDKELRKMGRAELLEMLIKEREENESLQVRLNASTTEVLEKNNQLAAMEDEVKKAQETCWEAQEKAAALEDQVKQLEDEKQKLIAEVDQAKTDLASRKIELEEAGSIAEASMKVHGIYQAAQAAADQYLENVRELKERQEAVCARRAAESKEAAERLLTETRQLCVAKQSEADTYYAQKKAEADLTHDKVMAATKTEVENYWNSLAERLESFYDAHAGMRDILSFYNMKLPVFGNSKPEDAE